MLLKLLFGFCMLAATPSQAQVLFHNPNFDTYSSCPDNLGQVTRSEHWIDVVNTADFYNCNFQSYGSYPTGTPSFSGTGCMGFASYGDLNGSAEAIGQSLAVPIVKGKSYSIRLMTKKAKSGAWSSNCGGVAFYGFKSTVPPATTSIHVSGIAGTDLLAKTAMITDTGWIPQVITFTAADNYSFVALTVEKVPSCKTYLFVDSLITKEQSGGSIAGISADALLRVYPNPSSGIVQVESSAQIDQIKVTDVLGRTFLQEAPNTMNYHLQIDMPGIYILHIFSQGQWSKHKIIIKE